jgi:phosphotriesterase-related protein
MGLKRDPLALRRVSQATGVNIVMGTGWYQKMFHPVDMSERTVEQLADDIVRDVTEGVNGTDVRSGIIGEIGVNGNPIEPNEIKNIRAAAQASRRTGAAITVHKGGCGSDEMHRVLTTFAEEGADLSRVVMGHSDILVGDIPFIEELLDRGVVIEFDLMGREASLVPSVTAQVAEGIPKLLERGHEDKLVLSHDVCWKVHLKHYGGYGYSYLLEKFLPHLRTVGVTDEQIDKMVVQNPKRILPLVEPK